METANKKQFTRKIFTAKLFFSDIFFLLSHIPQIMVAMRNKELGKQFMEKVMIVTTAVNGCVYCSWFHAKQATNSGISEKEIANMLKLQFNADASEHEIPALLFAQHYAETDRKPDADMLKKLNDFYGEKTASHILLFIRMIYFGNLDGNTFDAFLSRLKGIKAPNSNFFFELIFFIFHLPVMLPMLPFVGKYRSAE